MTRVTPTQLAEQRYEANIARGKPMKRGPAGIMIPDPTAIYRKTQDAELLTSIKRAAYAAHGARALPAEARRRASESLRADVLRRFPLADMQVLERYGLAKPADRAFVDILSGPYEAAERMSFAEPVLMPTGVAQFHVDLGGSQPATTPPVPADTVDYFRTVLQLRRDWVAHFDGVSHWVSVSRTVQGRWPRWFEIERQFPKIGAWLAGQRNG